MKKYLFVCMAVALGSAGCGPETTGPDSLSQDFSNLAWSCYDPTDPHCSNDPPPGDPDPNQPGIFLGDFTPELCSGGTDADQDGLHDFCEYQLALAFRPLLRMSVYEPAPGREPYWAATSDGSNYIIVYMFGYYQDNGDPGCPGPFTACDGHWGDNEFTIAYVHYDYDTQHWVLTGQFYSAHWGTTTCVPMMSCDFSKFVFRDNLHFPEHFGWYTHVWIAESKHANYPTQSSCNSGGLFDADDCTNNVPVGRFHVNHLRNVGSASHPFINAVTSINSPQTRPGTEYFWTDVNFCGWSVASGSRSSCAPTSYADVLGVYLSVLW